MGEASYVIMKMNNRIKIYLFIFLAFLGNIAYSQSNIDSLNNLVKIVKNNKKAEILNKIAFDLHTQSPEESLLFAERALQMAEETGDLKEKAFATNTLAILSLNQGDFNNAYKLLGQSLIIYEQIEDEDGIATILKNIGNYYFYRSDFVNAVLYYENSLDVYTESDNKIGMGAILNNLGAVNHQLGNYETAISFYLNATSILEELNNRTQITTSLNNIGEIYGIIGNYNKSLEFLNKALKISQETKDTKESAAILNSIGNIYHKLHDFETELNCYEEALELIQKTGDKIIYISTLTCLGDYYYETNEFNKALEYYNQVLSIIEPQSRKLEIANIFTKTGKIYAKFKNFEKAFDYFDRSLKISKQLNLKKEIIENYQSIAEASFMMGDYENAYLYHLKFFTLNDSLINEQSKLSINELQAKYETEKALKLLKTKDDEIIRKNFQIYAFVFGFIISLIFAIILYSQNKIIRQKTHKIEKINAELEEKIAEESQALELSQFSINNASFIIIWLSYQGKIVYANEAARNLLEYSYEEFLTMNIGDIDPKFPEGTWEKYWNEIKEKNTMIIETKLISKNNIAIPVEVTFNHAEFESEEYSFVYFQNISKRKDYEKKLKTAKERAEESERLKSAFLANMSHEIRTPMNAIIGFSQLLLNAGFSLERKQDFIDEIKQNGNALLNLVDNIIDISMIESGQMKLEKSRIPVKIITSEIYNIYAEKIKENAKLEFKLVENSPEKNPFLITDPTRFKQIVIHLIENALKFTDQGYIEIGYNLKNNNIIEFYVKDTGIGIPHNQQKFIFDVFNKVDIDESKVHAGAGLGLTISRNLVNLLGGKMWIDSSIGKGSTIYFTLPYFQSEDGEAESIYSELLEKEADWSNKKILIVEDVEANYLFLEAILEKTNVKLLWAKDGKEAVNICKVDKNIDMILMDIQLPIMNGFQATEEIRKLNPDIPIIAQTAYAFKGEKEKSFQAGCNDYVTKPIRKEILFASMSKYFTS